jgi:Ca2+-binding EF-hand superfamily protein
MNKTQIERMIWEFDEDLNKKITQKEFVNMYKKCTIDKNSA